MSYDINFWRPTKQLKLEPLAVYERLCRRKAVEGLARLPVKRIQMALKDAFPSFDPAETFPLAELMDGSMEVFWSARHFRFDFRGGDTDDERGRVWQIMTAFGCVCFDPQVNQVYSSDGPSPFAVPPRKRAQGGLLVDADRERARLKKLGLTPREVDGRMGEWLMGYCGRQPKVSRKKRSR